MFKQINNFIKTLPAPALFILSGTTQYLGASVAVGAFNHLGPTTTAWWRFALATVFLLAWQKPWRTSFTKHEIFVAGLFGIVMAGMNMIFYEAVSRVDLGLVVALEFIGPIALAVALNHGWRVRLAALLAFTGVILISGFGLDFANPQIGIGILLSFLAGAMWAGYIILGKTVSRGKGLQSLAVGCFTATIFTSPLAVRSIETVITNYQLLGSLLTVALLSTLIPYSLDQIIMRRLDASTFALLEALLPATSLIIGIIFLNQIPTSFAVLGLILVSVSVWLATAEQAI